jgi:hypothetical protein
MTSHDKPENDLARSVPAPDETKGSQPATGDEQPELDDESEEDSDRGDMDEDTPARAVLFPDEPAPEPGEPG